MATTKTKVTAKAHVQIQGVAKDTTVAGIFTADVRPRAKAGKKPREIKAEGKVVNGKATLQADLEVESKFWFMVTDVRQGRTSYPLSGELGPREKSVLVATVKSIELRYGV